MSVKRAIAATFKQRVQCVSDICALDCAGFSSLRLVSDKNYGAARSAAVGKVPADNLASLLVRMGTKSAVEALKLPSLTLEVRDSAAVTATVS